MLTRFAFCVLIGSAWMATGQTAENPAEKQESQRKTAHELRRDWIIRQAPKLIPDEAKLRQFIAGLDALNEFEMNEMANRVLGELDNRRKKEFAALRAANARERAAQAARDQRVADQLLQQQQQRQFAPDFFPAPPVVGFVREPYGFYPYPPAFFPPPAVGYFPVVAWLPAGVSFSTHAIISPDRRHVRMSVLPFFSTIGPVHTFNYMTGETRRLPQYDPPDQNPPPPLPAYDGLRTRDAREFRGNR